VTRRAEAVARLELSRQRLQRAMVGDEALGALGTSGTLLLHLVRRHPWASVAAAAALGALLARLRPWRWVLNAELWSALLPGLLARVAAAPVGTWSSLLAAFMQDLAAGQGQGDAASAPAQPHS